MFLKCAPGAVFAFLALSGLTVTRQSPAGADSFPSPPPEIYGLRQSGPFGNFVVVDWSSPEHYDYYTVTYNLGGVTPVVSDATGDGTGGEYAIGPLHLNETVVVSVTGWRLAGGVPVPGPTSRPRTIHLKPVRP